MSVGLKWDTKSAADMRAAFAQLKGAARRIRGVFSEHMEYAPKVEFGVGRVRPRPHMRPALALMVKDALPKMTAIFHRVLQAQKVGRDFSLDRLATNAVAAALYVMEQHRLTALDAQVYTAERFAREAKPGYSGYRLTGNLRQNRSIQVEADGKPMGSTGFDRGGSPIGTDAGGVTLGKVPIRG